MKGLIPAAGQGTRMRPATHAVSKEILPVAGKPAIQHVVEEAIAAGIEEFVVVIAPDKPEIVDHLTTPGLFDDEARFEFLVQREPKGLGHAILQARPAIEDEEALAVLYPDNIVVSEQPAIGQLIEIHEELSAPVSHVVEKPGEEISAYSAIEASTVREGLHRVHDMVEKPSPDEAPSNLAPIGRHILTPDIFHELERTEPGHGGEIQLTDAMATLAADGEHYAAELEGQRLDVGNPEGHVEANVVLDVLESEGPEARREAIVDRIEGFGPLPSPDRG